MKFASNSNNDNHGGEYLPPELSNVCGGRVIYILFTCDGHGGETIIALSKLNELYFQIWRGGEWRG